jgi:hypothetical protein
LKGVNYRNVIFKGISGRNDAAFKVDVSWNPGIGLVEVPYTESDTSWPIRNHLLVAERASHKLSQNESLAVSMSQGQEESSRIIVDLS